MAAGPKSISNADVELIRHARSSGKRYVALSGNEREAYQRVHAAIRELGKVVNEQLGNGYTLKLTSGFSPYSGVRGAQPKDLWFGIFPTENEDEFVGNPQLFLIVSGRGVEFGFSASTHPSDFSNSDIKQKVRKAAPHIFKLLPYPDDEAARRLASALEISGPWCFMRKERLEPDNSDFPNLDAWLSFMHSQEGVRQAGGNISRYVSGEKIDSFDMEGALFEAVSIFRPLMEQVRPSQPLEAAHDPQPTSDINATDPDTQDDETDATPEAKVMTPPIEPYTVDDILTDGCFIAREKLEMILERLRTKKNLILQGPPGTGKTWLAKRLAFALMGQRDDSKVRAVQFHPNLSYEDFIRGWRPVGDGKLTLVDGPFVEIMKTAAKDPMSRHVVVIEEINRGNPAQIFGEMLTLLEADKRTPNEALELSYKRSDGERVFITDNLYVIGTMNIADRSLALVDLALRRRFAFIDLEPTLNKPWHDWIQSKCGIDSEILDEIKKRLNTLNEEISADKGLGPQFRVGHSYVTPQAGIPISDAREWFRQVVDTEIGPLLDEY